MCLILPPLAGVSSVNGGVKDRGGGQIFLHSFTEETPAKGGKIKHILSHCFFKNHSKVVLRDKFRGEGAKKMSPVFCPLPEIIRS